MLYRIPTADDIFRADILFGITSGAMSEEELESCNITFALLSKALEDNLKVPEHILVSISEKYNIVCDNLNARREK